MRPGGGEKNSPPLPHPPWQIPLRSLRKILAIYPNECRSRSNAKLNAPSNASIALFSEDLAAKYLILLVGPGDVSGFNRTNDLLKGEGQIGPLILNTDLVRRPHPAQATRPILPVP
jgi:hypothetical protein